MKRKNILLTGAPGTGKTTVARRAAEMLGQKICGFYTAEVREGKKRRGFEIVTMGGRRAVLADINYSSPYRVGKYGVKPENLAPALEEIRAALKEDEELPILIDEIAKMEFFAPGFKETVLEAFHSANPVIATIMASPHPFCDELKKRPDVLLFEVTPQNRDVLPQEILDAFSTGSR